MFSLQSGDELVFGTPSVSSLPADNIIKEYDLILNQSISENNVGFSISQLQGEKRFVSRQIERNNRDIGQHNIKRIIHRDLERQRRNDMAQLHASLRSLLPLEHTKGKRSACDHIREAVNYIKHKQKHIEELKVRKENLKILTDLSGTETRSSNSSDNLPNYVTVNLDRNGVEILISSSINNFKLSKVLQELIKTQINVFNCISTKANERFLHKIQAEVVDLTSLDLFMLQERLIHLVN